MHLDKISASAADIDIPVERARATGSNKRSRCLIELTFTVYLADQHTSSVVMETKQKSEPKRTEPVNVNNVKWRTETNIKKSVLSHL